MLEVLIYFAEYFLPCKERNLILLESILFHFIFVFFILFTFIWWFSVKRKLDLYKNVFVQLLSRKKIQFPQDRSLVVRGGNFLEEELSSHFHCPIIIQTKIGDFSKNQYDNFMLPLCDFLLNLSENETKSFFLEQRLLGVQELTSYVKQVNNKKGFNFYYDYNKKRWNVEKKNEYNKEN